MIKRLFIVILVFTTAIITAQRNNSSPYSVFGIGEDFSPKTVEQSSMGGIGVAMKDLNHLNFVNPAAYADLRYATYGIGGLTSFLTLKESNASQSGKSTSLRYVTLAFPIGSKAGFSAGLQPLTAVGYSLLNQNVTGSTITDVSRYTGSGGTNRLYASFGIYAFKGFSLGLEGGFVFGTLDNTIINQKAGALATKYQKESTVRGGDLKLGAQYKTKLNNNLELSSGIALKLSNTLNISANEKAYSLSYGNSGQEIPRDVLFDRTANSSIKSPLSTVLGFGLGKENKWYVGLNSEFSSAINNSEAEKSNTYRYENKLRTSFGGFYLPKINSISNYWDRVTYRAGVRFEKTGLLVDGSGVGNNFTPINDFGINVGLGLPLPRQLSNVNLGFEYGQRGTSNNNLIKENYFNVRLSLSLNSLNWFKKRRID